MKKLPALLNTPARAVIAVVLIILLGELLIMLLIEGIHNTILKDAVLEKIVFEFIDPILLIAIVSPAFYLLIFKPMRAQQAELERQLDELRRFQRLSIGRELRSKELVEEIAALRHPLSVEPAGDLPVTSGSPETSRDAAAQPATTQPTEQGQRSALLFMLEDLEAARKKIEAAHQEWMAALDVVDDPLFLHDKEFRILRCNRAYQRCAGIPFHEIIGQPYYAIFPKADAPLPCCLRAMKKAEEEAEEEVTVGDASYRTRTFSVHDEQAAYLYSVHILEDITESRQTQAAFRALVGDAAANVGAAFFHETVRSLSAWLGVECVIVGEIVDGNRVQALAMQLDGKAIEHYEYALPGTPCNSVAQKGYCEYPEGVCQLFPADKDLVDMGAEAYVGIPVRDKNGKAIGVLCAISRYKLALPPMTRGVFEIIAARAGTEIERKRAEKALHGSEEKFRKMSEAAQDAIIMMANKRISFWNAAAERIFGYTAAEALGQEMHALITPPAAHAAFAKAFPHFQQSGEGPIIGRLIEVTALRKGGKEFPAELSVSATQFGGQWHAIGIVRDITERKQAQIAIEHANRALATLSAVNRSLVYATDENELLQAVCQTIVQQRGYRSAWVGYVQHDAEKTIRPMAQSGFEAGYLDALPLTWADSEYGQSPTGRAVRSGVTQISQNILLDSTYAAWREQALKQGFAASIALPLRNGSGVFGNLSIYAAEADAFDQAEIALLEEMAGDMAFGVSVLHTRHERDLALEKNQRQLVQLQDNLEDTVRAIATIVEMRDPYTAGHQARVADLAAAIARQMGLPDEQVHGVHLAGTVHDLGKINVPAEILSKPGKISAMEFGLIKIHPQSGYDILKDIDFPWPIAQMVLQHHERLDGSGYPQGFKGDAILLEARILAVADVVEAMSSHRPYRPGLGIEVALAEITKQRGIYFDPSVVDACLAVFREQHYAFKS